MGRKIVGPVSSVTQIKEPSALIEKKGGFAQYLADLTAYCATAPCKQLHGAKDKVS